MDRPRKKTKRPDNRPTHKNYISSGRRLTNKIERVMKACRMDRKQAAAKIEADRALKHDHPRYTEHELNCQRFRGFVSKLKMI